MNKGQHTVYGSIDATFALERLQDLCDPDAGVQTGPFGSQLHKEDYVEVGTPIITVEHLGENRILHSNMPRVSEADRERLSRYTLQVGDIVFSRVGSVDRRALVRRDEDGWMFSGRCLRVRPNTKKIDAEYLSYFFGLPAFKEYIRAIAVGATMPSLNTSLLSEILIPHPPLPEQRGIAAILGALDDKIELNRRMNETLEEMARALFKDWFIDFGPTRAKMEGHEPYLAPEIWNIFPDRLNVDSKPEGWEEKPLTEFFSIVGGGTPKTSVAEYWNGSIPWYSVKDTPSTGSVFVVETEKTITELGLDKSSARLIPKGTTIISARGTVGNLAVAGQDMTFNQSCYALRGDGAVGDCFVYLVAQHMVGQLQSMAHGSVFSTITRQTFETVNLPFPGENVLRAFEEITAPFFDRVLASVQESRTLAQSRDLLLPKLMSGEIRVADDEKLAGVVT